MASRTAKPKPWTECLHYRRAYSASKSHQPYFLITSSSTTAISIIIAIKSYADLFVTVLLTISTSAQSRAPSDHTMSFLVLVNCSSPSSASHIRHRSRTRI
ncbi:hypothetical protein BDZ89DRAFT_1069126 [Hymenopellis radicata]|nr:hypothetical protein BDZ89DRAFT_1069126 [Hymenopellis radicata]